MTATKVMTERKGELVIRRLRVTVTSGPDKGKSIESSDEITVGTDPSSTLVLDDTRASRMHFAIRPQKKGWLIRDLGSTNGTLVDNVRVVEALVEPGHTITAGVTKLSLGESSEVTRHALSEDPAWGRALGGSTAMRRLFAVLPRIAASEAVVLLEGETGTGKTLIAETIHKHSSRKDGPFIVVDCAAIAPTLVESELFGHEKGSFTNATGQRQGAFELAENGTVFFDELGELPLDLQPKLLRALEEKMIRRVGGSATVPLDVRVIAATNRDLRAEVNKKTFRSDLYYRLNTIRLRVPALRERPEDIELLATHFWKMFSADGNPAPPPALLDELVRREWPGNVRELRSAVERAVLLGDVQGLDAIEPHDSPETGPIGVELVDGQPYRAAKEQVTARWEKAYVRLLVDRNGGNVSKAARAARMDRSHLRELLDRYWPSDTTDDT